MVDVVPGDNVSLIPLIPGYNYSSDLSERSTGELSHDTVYYDRIPFHYFQNGSVHLFASPPDPERGIKYFQTAILPCLCRIREKHNTGNDLDLCLSDDDYLKVTTLIKEELARLKTMQEAHSQTAPAR